ncbi:MAG: ribonuclease Z [Flavobacteriales bacterium]
MTFEITILGCGAATPTLKHNASSQVVNIHDKLFLMDCGEGTQIQLRKYKIKFQRIQHIFISHLHGDHYLGLVGLISSLHLLGRKNDLHIYGPSELKEIIELNLRVSQTYLDYFIHYHAVNFESKEKIFEDHSLEIHSFPLKHRIPCVGYLFAEKPKQIKIRKEYINRYSLQPSEIIALKNGQSITTPKNIVVTPQEVCDAPEKSKSYAYCSDTMYWETLIPSIQGVDLLYHESTFLESEKERAKHTFHSTAAQAATIALKAGVGKLLLGHYSSRYSEEEEFVNEASVIFPNCDFSTEGKIIQV